MDSLYVNLPGQPLRLNATVHLGLAGGGSSAQRYNVSEQPEAFVVKLKGNPQGTRVLFNEYLSGRLGELIGAPFGVHALVQVAEQLLPIVPGTNTRLGTEGTQFGTVYYPGAQRDIAQLKQAQNFATFPAVLAFDTFIARRNGRQHSVYPSSGDANGPRDTGVIFDQGFAFSGSPVWTVASLAADRACVAEDSEFSLKQHYPHIDAYEPYIRCIEALTRPVIQTLVAESPLAEWGVQPDEAAALVEWLFERRLLVRPALVAFLV
jgi:hypothetical protein